MGFLFLQCNVTHQLPCYQEKVYFCFFVSLTTPTDDDMQVFFADCCLNWLHIVFVNLTETWIAQQVQCCSSQSSLLGNSGKKFYTKKVNCFCTIRIIENNLIDARTHAQLLRNFLWAALMVQNKVLYYT